MSVKIAPSPVQNAPRIAFLPNQTPILLIPTHGMNRVALPVRVSPNHERTVFVQPQIMGPPLEDQRIILREESGIAEHLPSTQQRREFLKRKIQERPSKQYLIRKHILLTDPLVEPFVGEKTQQLRKQAVVSNLNRKLKTRPGPLDLVTKKILQADAELEEAIAEGRLLFPSSRRELQCPSPSIPQAPSPSVLLSSLRISKQETKREEDHTKAAQSYSSQPESGMMGESESEDHRGRKFGRVDARSQPHPYARLESAPMAKSRLKGPDSRSSAEFNTVPDSFEAMMKQQELYIEWGTRPEMNGQGGSQTTQAPPTVILEEESDSGETIPYGGDGFRGFQHHNQAHPQHQQVSPQEQPDSSTTIVPQKTQRPAASYKSPIYALTDIKKTDLMQECRLRGLKCGGDKTAIMNRLDTVRDEIVNKYKEEQAARLEASMAESSPQISGSERALSNTSSSSSPSTIIDEISYDSNSGIMRVDESLASRRHSLPSNQSGQRSNQTRHLSMSNGQAPQLSSQLPQIASLATMPTQVNSLSFTQATQVQLNGQPERKIQMKTANGDIFYATLPSAEDLPIPRDGKPIGCRIAVVNGKPVLQFQQPNGPIEPGNVGVAGIRDTLLFAQNGSGGQVTLGPKERTRSNSLNRKLPPPPTFTPETTVSTFIKHNPIINSSSLPVVVSRANGRSQSTSSVQSRPKLSLPKERRKTPPAKPIETEEVETLSDDNLQGLTDAQRVFAHVKAINKLLNRDTKMTLDAKTVLEHEHSLRNQQKLIDQLTKELKKSQSALRMQQQLILSAKKAQSNEISKMTNEKLKSVGDAWLFELNMKRLHKSNTNFFLTHDQQMHELNTMKEDEKKLLRQHTNIQLNEASDSAIKDITKLISANPKTALLIVQLLRKYQNDKSSQNVFEEMSQFDSSPKTALPSSTSSLIPPIISLPPLLNEQPIDNQPLPMFTPCKSSTIITPMETESSRKESNESGRSKSPEPIVLDDDSHDEDKEDEEEEEGDKKSKKRKGKKVKVNMEEIFNKVLYEHGMESGAVITLESGSPPDPSNSSHNSPTHSIPSIHSSVGGYKLSPSILGPSTSTSPSSSSTISSDSLLLSQPHVAYHANPVFSQPPESLDFSSQSRPYVSRKEDNPTDILMEAVESSGIVDEPMATSSVSTGRPTPVVPTPLVPTSQQSISTIIPNTQLTLTQMPIPQSQTSLITLSSSHSSHSTSMTHKPIVQNSIIPTSSTSIINTANLLPPLSSSLPPSSTPIITQYEQTPVTFQPVVGPNEMFVIDAILNDGDIFHQFDDLNNSNLKFDDVDIDDLLAVLKKDESEKPSTSKKESKSYNGTEELNKILGPSWMNMDRTNQEMPQHMQMSNGHQEMPSTSSQEMQQHMPMDHSDMPSTSSQDMQHLMQMDGHSGMPSTSGLQHLPMDDMPSTSQGINDTFNEDEKIFGPSLGLDEDMIDLANLSPRSRELINNYCWLSDATVREELSPKDPKSTTGPPPNLDVALSPRNN